MHEGIRFFRRIFGRSLRLDLFIVICLVGIVPGLILCHVFLGSLSRRAVASRTSQVGNQCLVIANHLYMSGYLDGAGDTSQADSELAQLSNLYDGRVMLIDPDLRIIKDTYSLSEGKYMISPEVARGLEGTATSNYDGDDHYIEVITPISGGEDNDVVGVMLTSVSTESTDQMLSDVRNLCVVVLMALTAIVIGIAVFTTTRMVSQFRNLSRSIANIKEGFGEEEVESFSYRETEQISDAFNEVITKMKTLDDSRSEFVANVSHELKTPITSIKILAESLTAQDDLPTEIYREFMNDIVDEVDREDRIINDLLSLVRMDRVGTNLVIEKCDIDMMLEAIVKRLTPIADKAGVELVFETIRPVIAEVDETKLSLAFTNIIENGIKYNHEGGSVHIVLDSEPMMFTVSVTDTGIGIPEEDLPNIFERFYRVDKSHSREIGGTGLGLAIAKGSILMHKGAIKAESTVGEGSRFDIKIPLSYIVNPAGEQAENQGAGGDTP